MCYSPAITIARIAGTVAPNGNVSGSVMVFGGVTDGLGTGEAACR